MESCGIPGRVQITEQTHLHVYDYFKFEKREGVAVKGKGLMTTYLLAEEEVPIPSDDFLDMT
jgi:adenylate cyclase